MRARARLRTRGFTLLETIIAMGILAIGATTALALLVSATATGRHAEHLVNSAIIADSAFTDIEAELNGGFSPRKLETLEVAVAAPSRSGGVGDGPLRAAPYVDPRAAGSNASAPAPPAGGGSGGPPDPKKPAAFNGPPRAFGEDPFAKARTYWWKRDAKSDAYPDYKYDVAITPVGGPPDDPWEFLVEVVVRWTERGQKRDGLYQTILLKKLTHLDNEPPP
jgi:prepilin-type N-terminal cleavage/methylation domain-containing protein